MFHFWFWVFPYYTNSFFNDPNTSKRFLRTTALNQLQFNVGKYFWVCQIRFENISFQTMQATLVLQADISRKLWPICRSLYKYSVVIGCVIIIFDSPWTACTTAEFIDQYEYLNECDDRESDVETGCTAHITYQAVWLWNWNKYSDIPLTQKLLIIYSCSLHWFCLFEALDNTKS